MVSEIIKDWIATVTVIALVAAFGVLVFGIIFSVGSYRQLFSIHCTVITGNSMTPDINSGDNLEFTESFDITDLNIGNIVEFKDNNGSHIIRRVHEIIGKSTEGNQLYYVTKGTNETMPDGRINPAQIIGLWTGNKCTTWT